MQSKATTPEQYIEELPEDRKEQIKQVRETILANLPEGYQELSNYGMIVYEIPLSVFPKTYNKKPLMYAALASQKNHMAVYLSGIYSSEDLRLEFEEAYKATGKKMNMGKSCVRFNKIENLPLELVGEAIAKFSVDEFIAIYHKARAGK